MLAEHWPFWLGALALAAVAIAFLIATGGVLGVSGSYARVVAWRETRERERAERAMPDDAKALEAMLIAATLEEFGGTMPEELKAEAAPQPAARKRLSLSLHALLLASIALGGLLSALLSGSLALGWDLEAEFVSTLGDGWRGGACLVVGGMLVGFGTSMAGGCTSGHGLSGCSRFQIGSIAATSIFFGTGILVSLLLSAL